MGCLRDSESRAVGLNTWSCARKFWGSFERTLWGDTGPLKGMLGCPSESYDLRSTLDINRLQVPKSFSKMHQHQHLFMISEKASIWRIGS